MWVSVITALYKHTYTGKKLDNSPHNPVCVSVSDIIWIIYSFVVLEADGQMQTEKCELECLQCFGGGSRRKKTSCSEKQSGSVAMMPLHSHLLDVKRKKCPFFLAWLTFFDVKRERLLIKVSCWWTFSFTSIQIWNTWGSTIRHVSAIYSLLDWIVFALRFKSNLKEWSCCCQTWFPLLVK